MVDDAAADKVKGTAEKMAGKVTGDRKMEAEGKFDKAKGAVEDFAKDAKAGAEVAADKVKDAFDK